MSRETTLEIIQALVNVLAAHPRALNFHESVFQIMDVLYELRLEEGVDDMHQLKSHMTLAINHLTSSKEYDWTVVYALSLITTIHKLCSTALGELAASSELDLLSTFLGMRLPYHDRPAITRLCTEISDILVSVPYVSRGPVHTQHPTAAGLILGYMELFPDGQEMRGVECQRLDVLLKSRAGTFSLTPENLSFVSGLIQDQQTNMNGPAYNSQEYVLWRLVEACIDMETPANVPQSLYDTLQSCFPIDFLLRTLVCRTSAPKPGSQLLQSSETILRVCKLIGFQTQYVSDGPCALSSRKRFLEKNGISVFMDVIDQLPKKDLSLLDISTKYTCIHILLRIFAENEAAVATALTISLPYAQTVLRDFAYGAREPTRTTYDMASFLIDDLIDTAVAKTHVFGKMYIRGIRDTIHLLWVLVKCSDQFSRLIRDLIGHITDNVNLQFRHWHPFTDATGSCVFQQHDDFISIAQLVWYFDDMVCRVALDENMCVCLPRYIIEGLERYVEKTPQYRKMFSKIYYVIEKARHPALVIPPLYNEPSFPPT